MIRYNERQQREEEKKAIDAFIRAYQMKHEGGIDKAIERFSELGMGEGTGERIKEEMLKKGMTVSGRGFMNLPRKGRARQLDVMEFAR